MARRLRLRRFGLENVNFEWLGAFRLRVEADDPEATGTDTDVFLFNRGQVDPRSGEQTDYFMGVAGPVDMADYPSLEPDDRTAYLIFRRNWFEIDLRSTAVAQVTWEEVVKAVTNLLLALDRMEKLVVMEELFIGPAPSGSSSSSSLLP